MDDDPILLKVATMCLQLDHHQVRTASDLTSGVELLKREPVDLILTDLFANPFAPDAIVDLGALTEVAPATPMVLTTAHSQAAAYDPAQFGLAAILVKPFAAGDFRALVERVLADQRQQLEALKATAAHP